MKIRTTVLSALILAGVMTLPAYLSAQSSSSEFTSFDAPGAGTASGSGFGTIATGINSPRAITGRYIDAHNVNHGFLRKPSGDDFVTFDAPGAGNSAGSGFGTFATSINDAGTITGHYTDAHNLNHGFLRSPSGDKLIVFDAPGAGNTPGSGQGTFPESISNAGFVTGHFIDSNNVNHGFLRAPGGDKVMTFDAPGAGKTPGSGQGTFADGINQAGAITGHYLDSNNMNHSLLRAP